MMSARLVPQVMLSWCHCRLAGAMKVEASRRQEFLARPPGASKHFSPARLYKTISRRVLYPFWYLAGLVLFWAIVPFVILTAADLLRTRRTRLAVRHHQWFWAYLFLSVALAWSTLFLFYPLVKASGQSLTNFSLTAAESTRFVGLENYRQLLGDDYWWHSVLVTLIYVAGTLPVGILLSLFLAVQILKQPPFLQTFFKGALFTFPASSAPLSLPR